MKLFIYFISFGSAITPMFLYYFFKETLMTSSESLNLYLESSLIEQLLVTLCAFAIKPIYMSISIMNFYLLKDAISIDVISIRKAMLYFFIGESFCAINYLFFNEGSILIDYLHNLGMIACFGFTAFAIIEFIDIRFIKFGSDKEKCALLKNCGQCYKYSEVECNIKKIMEFSILIILLCSFFPLLSTIRVVSYNSNILGSPYFFNHPIEFQWFESRYCPAISIFLFLVAYSILKYKPFSSLLYSKIFMSMGFAFLGFGLFRLIPLNLFYNKMGWFIAWEELTELFFVITVFYIIYLYRRHLHPNPFLNFTKGNKS
jgi:hypothetical protein